MILCSFVTDLINSERGFPSSNSKESNNKNYKPSSIVSKENNFKLKMTETLFFEESSKKNIRMVCVLKYVACA